MTDYDRYAYVGNNPIIYTDPSGHKKVIIMYSNDPKTNAFEAAAITQKQIMLEAGYSEEDILMVQVSNDDQFFAAIEESEINEIEQVHIFSHGWGRDGRNNQGGLQLTAGIDDDNEQLTTSEDLNSDAEALADRFAGDAEIHINACEVGVGSLPQDLANTLDTHMSSLCCSVICLNIKIPL